MPEGLQFKVTNAKQLEKWFGTWVHDVDDSQKLMAAIATFNLQQIFRTFRGQGARDGFQQWRAFRKSTLHPTYHTKSGLRVSSTWNIRYGTDMQGKKPRRKRGANVRRYSASSKLLQASGGFRNSFRAMRITSHDAIVGSTMQKAPKIISDRPVIRVSNSDLTHFRRLLIEHFMPGPVAK
jgi:hypothetical protein